MKKLWFLGLWFGLAFLAGTNLAHAQIKIDVDREFTVSQAGNMSVAEVETVRNTYTDRFVPGGATRIYYFAISAREEAVRKQVAEQIYKSLEVRLNGQKVNFERVEQPLDSVNVIIYGFRYQFRLRLNPNTSQTVRITYNHPELAEKSGGLLDAYIPAFADNFSFDNGQTNSTYRTKLRLPKNSGELNIMSVTPTTTRSEAVYDVYEFAQEALRGKFAWVQRGNQQVYEFEIAQELPATSSQRSGELNEYRMILPRDIDEVNVAQQVFFTEITPEPVAIEQDPEGNIIGVFRLPAHESKVVEIKGYALLKNKKKQDLKAAGTVDMIAAEQELVAYLKPAEYWEVDAAQINDFATKQVGATEDVYQVMDKLYAGVVSRIDYSQVKRFGLNERQGALRTLSGGAAVCMEYSDLYLTALRNRGIPARAAFGYGYDSRLPADAQEAHQWVQVYLPKFKAWVSVDVTWGESGTNLIGGDLNHFYTHLAAEDPNTPSLLSRLSLSEGSTELAAPTYKVKALAEVPAGKYFTPADVLAKYPKAEGRQGDFLGAFIANKYVTTLRNLVTSPGNIDVQGWGMVFLTCLVLLLIIVLIVSIARRLRKLAKRSVN